MTYNQLWHQLTPPYTDGEAKAIVRLVLQRAFGLSLADILCGKVSELSEHEQDFLEEMILRLQKGEPVQYVLGEEEFCGRLFKTDARALIPRPETEELCNRIIQACNCPPAASKPLAGCSQLPLSLLDIGTGTGCIAITLALELVEARVTAWDVSAAALSLAKENAERLGAKVSFEHCDILSMQSDERMWDLIVSNPPYVCEREKQDMLPHVLEHEPALALFVPDEDPLRFYRAISNYAAQHLKAGGQIWFEVNEAYAQEVCELLEKAHFIDIFIINDGFDKPRFVKGQHA